jgi:hypothetical protein
MENPVSRIIGIALGSGVFYYAIFVPHADRNHPDQPPVAPATVIAETITEYFGRESRIGATPDLPPPAPDEEAESARISPMDSEKQKKQISSEAESKEQRTKAVTEYYDQEGTEPKREYTLSLEDNQLHGTYRSYYRDPTRVHEEKHYNHGVLEGQARQYHDNGERYSSTIYQQGQARRIEEYDTQGRPWMSARYDSDGNPYQYRYYGLGGRRTDTGFEGEAEIPIETGSSQEPSAYTRVARLPNVGQVRIPTGMYKQLQYMAADYQSRADATIHIGAARIHYSGSAYDVNSGSFQALTLYLKPENIASVEYWGRSDDNHEYRLLDQEAYRTE